ncbi:MAG: hypothetical protein OEV23_07555 [Gallionella sp.]|nr:hypothetical protein [Gallionella sp.]
MFANKLASRICIAVTVLLGGCATLDKINAPSLSGSPTTSALVVVKSEAVMHGMLGLKTPQQVEGGVLLSTDGSKRVEGRAVAGLIIFSDVAPGEYNLAIIQTTWRAGNMVWQHTYNVPPEKALNFVISVKVGEPKYLGVVTIEEIRKTTERGVIFELKPSKEGEDTAWEKFTQLYQGSPWASEVQKRMAEPKQ